MPTFSTIALENLLEPRVRDSYKKVPESKHINGYEKEEGEIAKRLAPNHIYISPALYVTPEPAPIPETSSDSLSPSPYVVNHKRRGGEAVVNRKIDGFEVQILTEKESDVDGDLDASCGNGLENEEEEEELVEDNIFGLEVNGDGENDDFLDSKDEVTSVGSATEGRRGDCQSLLSTQAEFFDADEDFSSDGSNTNSCGQNMELELRAMRLRLLDEIERRKTAEDALELMHSHWQRIRNVFSQAGIRLPATSNTNGNMQIENDAMEQLSQEVVVARFVAESIGKGLARAEAELAAEAVFESKNQEISRLRDRLQYYEAVNHEMCQRNQEIFEIARKKRQRRKTRRRWMWSCLGLSLAAGVSIVAYLYLPHTTKHQSSRSEGTSDSSCLSIRESA